MEYMMKIFLLWIEPQYVDYKARKAVDDALEDYHKLCDFCEDWRNEPSVKVIPSDVKGLQDMSININYERNTDAECDI